ncbi:MAG: hypothetical protein ACLFPX_02695 [Candidatus Omnitrophota bacterium]
MAKYEPKFIHDYADGLYKEAKSVVTCHFFIGMFAGMLVFLKVAEIAVGGFDFLIVAIGTFIGAVMGYNSGRGRSYEMQLEAQQALCQLNLEQNTRGAAECCSSLEEKSETAVPPLGEA